MRRAMAPSTTISCRCMLRLAVLFVVVVVVVVVVDDYDDDDDDDNDDVCLRCCSVISNSLALAQQKQSDDAALLRFLSQPTTLQTIDLKYALRTCNKVYLCVCETCLPSCC
jgi:hypothetical protein